MGWSRERETRALASDQQQKLQQSVSAPSPVQGQPGEFSGSSGLCRGAFDITMVALCCPLEYWKVTGHPVAWRPDLEKIPPGTSGLGQQQSRDSGCRYPGG